MQATELRSDEQISLKERMSQLGYCEQTGEAGMRPTQNYYINLFSEFNCSWVLHYRRLFAYLAQLLMNCYKHERHKFVMQNCYSETNKRRIASQLILRNSAVKKLL
jgi:hypothetical protein